MALLRKTTESLLERGYSRRMIGRISMGAAAAIPFLTNLRSRSSRTGPGGRRGPAPV